MSVRFLSFCLIVALLLAEGSVALWQHWRPDTSQFPLFSWPQGLVVQAEPSANFKSALALYKPDRGSMVEMEGPDQTHLTAFYFEWDRLEAGPIMAIGGHAPEVCNASNGFHLLGKSAPHVFSPKDAPDLPFDTTHFTSRAGESVYVFKLAWLQGFGAWALEEQGGRVGRLQKSFLRASGAGRVLQAGVFGARDEDHAWHIFQTEILQNLLWQGTYSR